jgi:hypothetical protein
MVLKYSDILLDIVKTCDRILVILERAKLKQIYVSFEPGPCFSATLKYVSKVGYLLSL